MKPSVAASEYAGAVEATPMTTFDGVAERAGLEALVADGACCPSAISVAVGVAAVTSLTRLPRLGEHVPEDAGDLVELRLAGDQRRRDLDHRVAAVVGAADQALLEERGSR